MPVDSHSDISNIHAPLQIEKIKVLRGANYYSAGAVIVVRLNLGSYDERFTHTIEGFYENLQDIFPGLFDHHCSEQRPGGFFKRVQEGTLLGHVVEHVAIELQTLAGMNVGFGKTRETRVKGVYNVVFRYIIHRAGVIAAKAAVHIINSILLEKPVHLESIIKELISIKEQKMPGPGTQAIIDEARKREIPVLQLDSYKLIQLGTGKHQQRIRETLSPNTSHVSVENVRDSFLSTLMMRDAGIPVAISLLTDNMVDLLDFKKKLAKPIALKTPLNEKDRSVFTGLDDSASVERAFDVCRQYSKQVLAQEQIPGECYRLLIINHKFAAATKLDKPQIIGDGIHSIAQLISNLNSSQNRTSGNNESLSTIVPNEKMTEVLSFNGYLYNSIPDHGVKIVLNHHTSPSQGALTNDVTGLVHPINRFLAERAAQVCGLDVAGVNIICPDISKPITQSNGVILNVLAGPDFRMHILPWKGKARRVEEAFIDMIFPQQSQKSIPLFSVTGSAGKSICAYLINFLLEKEGFITGLAHSDGIYSAGRKIVTGDMAKHDAASLLLKDPAIDCAVLETSVESIIKDGLGYELADFGIVLNAHDRTYYDSDLEGADDIAYTQSVVGEEVYPNGFSVLNACDPLVVQMKERIYCNLALFAQDTENDIFKKHVLKGGWGCGIEKNNVVLWSPAGKKLLAEINEIPLLADERNHIFIDSFLAAVLAVAAKDVLAENIKNHIKAFRPALHNMHGRLSGTTFNEHEILIDKPSGPAALKNIKKIIEKSILEPVFYLDLSGNPPQDFAQHFIQIFAKHPVYLFSSAIHSAKRLGYEEKESNKNLIISLKEYYLTQTAVFNANLDQPMVSRFSIKEMPSHLNITEISDMQEMLQLLQQPQNPKLHIIFSWNFSELNTMLHPFLEYD